MNRFTYEIKTQGPKRTLIAYDNGKQIYISNPTFTATDAQLLEEAKVQLVPNYGQEVNNMTQIPSQPPTPPPPPTAPVKKEELDKNKETINQTSDTQKAKFADAVAQSDDKKKSIRQEVKSSIKSSRNKLLAILIPILLQFITVEMIITIIIKLLIRRTKKRCKDKGILNINNLTLTFTPTKKGGNYTYLKTEFDSRVTRLKNIINTLKTIITILRTASRIINTAITLLLIYIRIKTKIRMTQYASITSELASPAQAKPTAGLNIIKISESIGNLEQAKQKIEKYREILRTAGLYIESFSSSINKASAKVNRLQFILILPSSPGSQTPQVYSAQGIGTRTAPEREEYVSSNGKSYILILVRLSNGFRQYQALDSYSKFKISQTAPSKVKTDQELLDEIKSIIG